MQYQYTPDLDSIKIIKDSLTHDLLMVSKVYNSIITYSDLHEINKKKYYDKSKVDRSLLYLSLHGLVHLQSDTHWIITPKGISFLYHFASKFKKKGNVYDSFLED